VAIKFATENGTNQYQMVFASPKRWTFKYKDGVFVGAFVFNTNTLIQIQYSVYGVVIDETKKRSSRGGISKLEGPVT
jgi:hypothetical protein